MAYAEIRPVHVADLLSREGHTLAARALTARVTAARQSRSRDSGNRESREFDAGAAARRTLGVAAGAMIVVGTVAAGVLGLNHGSNPTPTAAGEPVGAAPGSSNGKGSPVKPNEAPGAQAVAPYTNTASSQSLPQAQAAPSGPAGQIGTPARVNPPVAKAPAPQAPRAQPPTAPPPAQQTPAPSAPAAGPVQSLAAPVAQTVGGSTLDNVVAPVTQTVDNTLQPALSLIGGLLGR